MYEWFVDCYRMRVDDDYAHGGGNTHGLYDIDGSGQDILQDFLIFCKMAVQHGVLPRGWDWSKLIAPAVKLLVYAFEKDDAQDKWGGENLFSAMLGGRSLRYTAEIVYGCSCMAGLDGSEELYAVCDDVDKIWDAFVLGRSTSPVGDNMAALFQDVGGVEVWKKMMQKLPPIPGR